VTVTFGQAPKVAGTFRMPAEWERHEATWLAWPKANDNWPDNLGEVQALYVRLIEAILEGEKVSLLVDDQRAEDDVRKKLRSHGVNAGSVDFYRIPTCDIWIRDYGPTFIIRCDGPAGLPAAPGAAQAGLAMNDWEFNAWGGKYEDRLPDNGVPTEIATLIRCPLFRPGIFLEGGAIDVNGRGLLMTTESCLLNENRNPHLTKEEIEKCLRDHLGIESVLWLRGGLEHSDTDGHVDEVARFVDERTVVFVVSQDPGVENGPILEENKKRLGEFVTPTGGKFSLVSLPLPGRGEGDGGRVPASYANFYIANACVIVPQYGVAEDQRARAILRDLFPSRKIVPVDARCLVQGLGAIHCATQQEPAIR